MYGALIPLVEYGDVMKDYEVEAIRQLQGRNVFTGYTTDEPGEVDEAVTVRLLAVVLWRAIRYLEARVGDGMLTRQEFIANLSDDEIRRLFESVPGVGGFEGDPEYWIGLKADPDNPKWGRFFQVLMTETYLMAAEARDGVKKAADE